METRGVGQQRRSATFNLQPRVRQRRPQTEVLRRRRPGCGAAGQQGSGAAWPLRAGCHGGNAARATRPGPGSATSPPGLPAPRFGTRGWAQSGGLGSLPFAPRNPALPRSLPPLPKLSPSRLPGPLEPGFICFATATDPIFPNSLSHVGVSYT